MGFWKPLLCLVVAAMVLLVAVAAIGYAADYGLESRVNQKSCSRGNFAFVSDQNTSRVTVKTKLLGIQYTVTGLSSNVCNALQPGNFVVYRVRSDRTSVYESEGGACMWDSVAGPNGCP